MFEDEVFVDSKEFLKILEIACKQYIQYFEEEKEDVLKLYSDLVRASADWDF